MGASQTVAALIRRAPIFQGRHSFSRTDFTMWIKSRKLVVTNRISVFMTPFLYRIAQAFYQQYGADISQLAFVFPNRRSGIFFQKYLAEVAGKPLFSPRVTTINDLMSELSPYTTIDRISLLVMLYKRYIELRKSDESFDDFVFWGDMLLGDFDDVDKYMVDARQLFTNIHDLKEIDEFYLTDEQIEIIKRFWGHLFFPSTESENKQQFIQLWQILFDLYSRLRADLTSQNRAYEGMIFREVAERCRRKEPLDLPYTQVVFVGFNAITEAERVFMEYLRDTGIGDFYWDYYAPTLQDPYNKAAFFLNDNKHRFPSKIDLDEAIGDVPQIELISIPSAVGQAKQAADILRQLTAEGQLSPERAINTAIVLPDEELLLPMLHSIPAEIATVNITMGYTLQHTTVAALMDAIFQLQRHVRFVKGEPRFYHLDVKQLLGHRFVASRAEQEARRITTFIGENNRTFVSRQELGKHRLIELLFAIPRTADEAAAYLIALLEYLQQDNSETTPDNEDDAPVGFSAVEKEFIYHYYITIKRLRDVIGQQQISMSVETFFRLLGKMAASISIPFRGEPLSGLQIMGVLETRALDFDNLVILSMNEGIFPVKKVAPSFIPYNLRRGFGMATTEHQDSIYAYYFYRMISRAKRVFLLYDNRTEGLKSGEVSRYVYQLKYHYRIPMREIQVNCDIATFSPVTIAVDKHKFGIEQKLAEFLQGGERALSASAINRYLNCPLQFYLQYIEQIEQPDDVTESVDSSTFGSIYHGMMQRIYNRIKGDRESVTVTADHINAIRKDKKLLTQYLEECFAQDYYKTPQKPEPLTGYDFLTGEIILKLIDKTLETDRALTPFTYIASEFKIVMDFPIGDNRAVRLKGFIDRIDLTNGHIRIVDYKTGKEKLDFTSVADLFDSAATDRRKAILQVLLYCQLYKMAQSPAQPIYPSIYIVRNLFDRFEWFIKYERDPLTDFSLVEQDFVQSLTDCLNEIFNLDKPFVQTQEESHCQYCDFKLLCKR